MLWLNILAALAGLLVPVAILAWATAKPGAWCEWYISMSDVYPPRWYWPIVRIYGGPDGQLARTCYMTRVLVGPRTPWGQLYLHFFHREDMDRDPHDHPFDFWTLPLNQGYIEEVYEHDAKREPYVGCFKTVDVPRFRVAYRPATHTHRVVATSKGTWPLVTLVWRSPNKRKWGFWTHWQDDVIKNEDYQRGLARMRFFTPYQDYVYQGRNANVEGVDISCPGTSGRFTDARKP